MNLLFLTLLSFESLSEKNIYTDLLREFATNGHFVYIVSPVERSGGKPTHINDEPQCRILRLRIGNIQKTNLIEKGITTLTIERKFIRGIEKHFSDIRFDMVLYSTPPITLYGTVKYVKKRDGAKSYLLLKDIFPQNALDIGMMSPYGWRGFLYKFFRKKEKKLYAISDHIGCMSEANVSYIISQNREIPPKKVSVLPNCLAPCFLDPNPSERKALREKYMIPLNKVVFLYGGNLGKPQDVPFIISCIDACRTVPAAHFVICGNGTDYPLLEKYVSGEDTSNVTLLRSLPREEYERFVYSCDCGLIFLDHRFTIPNFPSRLLSYMNAALPVVAATDIASDVGSIIESGGFGRWCGSDNVQGFRNSISDLCDYRGILVSLGRKARQYFLEHYTTDKAYEDIFHEYERLKNENTCN